MPTTGGLCNSIIGLFGLDWSLLPLQLVTFDTCADLSFLACCAFMYIWRMCHTCAVMRMSMRFFFVHVRMEARQTSMCDERSSLSATSTSNRENWISVASSRYSFWLDTFRFRITRTRTQTLVHDARTAPRTDAMRNYYRMYSFTRIRSLHVCASHRGPRTCEILRTQMLTSFHLSSPSPTPFPPIPPPSPADPSLRQDLGRAQSS
jgi:hypothetical protein